MNGEASFERWQIGERFKSRTCPRALITPESQDWIRLYSHYEAGFLLQAGALMEQPAIYLSAMRAIGGFIAEDRREWQQKQN